MTSSGVPHHPYGHETSGPDTYGRGSSGPDTYEGDTYGGEPYGRGSSGPDTYGHPPVPARRRPPRPPAAALLGLVLLALLGVWLVAAPFLLGVHGPGDQGRGAAWTAATRVDVSTGAAITAVAVATLLGYLASSITWLARYRQAE